MLQIWACEARSPPLPARKASDIREDEDTKSSSDWKWISWLQPHLVILVLFFLHWKCLKLGLLGRFNFNQHQPTGMSYDYGRSGLNCHSCNPEAKDNCSQQPGVLFCLTLTLTSRLESRGARQSKWCRCIWFYSHMLLCFHYHLEFIGATQNLESNTVLASGPFLLQIQAFNMSHSCYS